MVELQQENRKGASNNLRKKKQNKSLLCEAKVFPSEVQRRGRTKFRELLANESSSASPLVVEKTLHVDSIQNMKYQTANSSSATKGMTELLVDDDHDKSTSSDTKETLPLDSNVEGETKRLSSTSMETTDSCSSYHDAKANSKTTNSDSLGSLHHKKSSQESSDDSFQDFVSFTSSEDSSREKLHLESKVPKGSDVEENSNGHNHESITLISSSATARGKIDLESTRRLKSSLPISSQLALAPPLPKSPSESWLKRTLPTISSRNSTRQSTLGGRIYGTRQNTVF